MRLLTKKQAFTALYNAVSILLALADLLPLWLADLGITANVLVVFFLKSGGALLGKLIFDQKPGLH